MDKDEIKEAFGEDVDIIRKGTSETTYYVDGTKKLQPRSEITPNNIGTAEKIMKIATGRGSKVYETPLQFAIALKGFEQWCIDKNVAPSYAGLSFYLNISKDTLIKYTRDKTEFTCYNLIDSITGEYIYSTNDKFKLDKYINSNYIVMDENSIKPINYIKDNKINKNKVISVKDKVSKGEYIVDMCTVNFAKILAPINNLLEMVNISKAEVARNPAWHIFLAKNNFGKTTQYVDQVQQQITVNNPLDEMSDEEILKAAESRPESN